jgi:acetoin utilization deacetylase AcuC-like enzyme
VNLAGADPCHDDRLGRLLLSTEGLQARDRVAMELCDAASMPVAVVMAGGCDRNIRPGIFLPAASFADAFPQFPRA